MIHGSGNPPPPGSQPEWPQELLDRIHRVFQYHQESKQTYDSVRASRSPDPRTRPAIFRTFDSCEKVPLPTNLMAAEAPAGSLLLEGRDAVPGSQLDPVHDLRTLASWLFYADGVLGRRTERSRVTWLRTLTSNGETFPCELYVAAFAVEGLPAGLYYYSPREFALRKLRDGLGVLAQLKRGRPDLEYLKTIPAALLVSTIFARSTWMYQKRGYRTALIDAGILTENLVQTGTAIGMQVTARLRVSDLVTRELIGVSAQQSQQPLPYDHVEVVQSMVTWNDPLPQPLSIPPGPAGPMLPIPRPPAPTATEPYETVLLIHEDCVAPGVAIREIRPPLTELSPVPPNLPGYDRQPVEHPGGGKPLGPMLMKRSPPPLPFARKAMARDPFLTISRLPMRRATYYPLVPETPHVALVRPLWFIHSVLGIDSGVWYYHPPTDRWSMLARGSFRVEAAYLSREQAIAGDASAVCVLIANVHLLLQQAGPDTYRLAQLEAGIVADRMQLLAEAYDYVVVGNVSFYDDELRKFFGLEHGGWEVIHQICIGEPHIEQQAPKKPAEEQSDEGLWRD